MTWEISRSRASKEVRGSGSRPGDPGGEVGATIEWSVRPAVSKTSILASRHADRGMMGGSGHGVNAGMGLVDGVDHTELSTQQ